MKKHIAYTFFFCTIFCSCATIFNEEKQSIAIETEKNNTIIKVNDQNRNQYGFFYVARSKDTLKIQLDTGTHSKTFKIAAHYSPVFLFGNLLFPIGYLSDISENKKMYEYPDAIYIDSQNRIYKNTLNYEGKIIFKLELPLYNYFIINSDNNMRKYDGICGINVGFEYYYKTLESISFQTGLAWNGSRLFSDHYDTDGIREQVRANYFCISKNHRLKKWSLGYGASFMFYRIQIRSQAGGFSMIEEDIIEETDLQHFGLIFSAKYILRKHLSLGLNLYPTLGKNPRTKTGFSNLANVCVEFGIPGYSVKKKSESKIIRIFDF